MALLTVHVENETHEGYLTVGGMYDGTRWATGAEKANALSMDEYLQKHRQHLSSKLHAQKPMEPQKHHLDEAVEAEKTRLIWWMENH